MLSTRTTIVHIARTWLGTPYHHQASLKGIGCDCLGLVRGVWRELYGTEPEPLPAYTRDWAEAQGRTERRETLLEAARRHLVEVPAAEAQPGDILIFRWRRHAPAKHCAILATPATMIHALEGALVSEVSLSPWWRRHLAGVFAFPEPANGTRDYRGSIPLELRLADLSCGEDHEGEQVSPQRRISLPEADQSLATPLNDLDCT